MKNLSFKNFCVLLILITFSGFVTAQEQAENENILWEKVNASEDYLLCVDFCEKFPKSKHINEASEKKTRLAKEMIKTRFKGIFGFFDEEKPYDFYFSKKKCVLNGTEIKWPITDEFKQQSDLRHLPDHIRDLGNILKAYLNDTDYDAEFRYYMTNNRLSLDFHYWPGGYGYYFDITWEFEKDNLNKEKPAITELLISPPESYD